MQVTPDPSWHLYWQNPGDSGLAPRLKWTLPDGASSGAIQWPAPEVYEAGGLVTYVYHNAATLLVPITVPDSAGTYPIQLNLSWLACAEVCVPGSAMLSATLTVSADTTSEVSEPVSELASARATMPTDAAELNWSAHAVATDAGITLSLTPAVHDVRIIPLTAGLLTTQMSLQATDIDSDGVVLPYAQPRTADTDTLSVVVLTEHGAVSLATAIASPTDELSE